MVIYQGITGDLLHYNALFFSDIPGVLIKANKHTGMNEFL